MESLLHLHPSRAPPDMPPPELGRHEACKQGKRIIDGYNGWWTGHLDLKVLWLTPYFSSPPPQCSLLPWSVPSLAQGCAAAAWPGETWTTVKSRKRF